MRIGQGWIAFADEAQDYVEAIDAYLSNAKLAEHAGETGRALVERTYNWPMLAQQFADLLLSGAVPSYDYSPEQPPVLETINSRA
jgi:glycosyltransferase involved in cell wall biosynthesis